jgi:hypothetical protein
VVRLPSGEGGSAEIIAHSSLVRSTWRGEDRVCELCCARAGRESCFALPRTHILG